MKSQGKQNEKKGEKSLKRNNGHEKELEEGKIMSIRKTLLWDKSNHEKYHQKQVHNLKSIKGQGKVPKRSI